VVSAGSVGGFSGLPGGVAVSHLSVYDWPAEVDAEMDAGCAAELPICT
jgi:hypothetical protein